MKKAIFWVIGILAIVGLAVGLIFWIGGIPDISNTVSTISEAAPSGISTSAGVMG